MMVQTIDWENLKADYMASEEYSVRQFLMNEKKWTEGQATSGNTYAKTKDWWEQKRALRLQIADQRMKEVRAIEAERQPELLKAKLNAVNKLVDLLKNATDPKEIETIYKTLKIELGEPTTIAKNENVNRDDDKVKELTAQLDELVKNATEVE